MKEAIRRHHISFKNAFAGILWAIRTQPNFRVHLLLSVLAVYLGLFLKITAIEMTLLAFTVVFGLTAEMVNTSIEKMTDLITTEWRKDAKIAKDVSAGMMLVASMGAVAIAVLIFGPRLRLLFGASI